MASSSKQTPRERRAEEIAQHAINNAAEGRTTVTLKLWVNPETMTVRMSSGEASHPFPHIAHGVRDAAGREKLHAQLDAVLDAIDRLS